MNGEEVQVDRVAVQVGVQDAGDFRANLGADAEFFFEFAAQGLGRGLSGLDLAAGEFPLERESLVLGTLAAEDFVAANY